MTVYVLEEAANSRYRISGKWPDAAIEYKDAATVREHIDDWLDPERTFYVYDEHHQLMFGVAMSDAIYDPLDLINTNAMYADGYRAGQQAVLSAFARSQVDLILKVMLESVRKQGNFALEEQLLALASRIKSFLKEVRDDFN